MHSRSKRYVLDLGLRDPASWRPLFPGVNSRNLTPSFMMDPVVCKPQRQYLCSSSTFDSLARIMKRDISHIWYAEQTWDYLLRWGCENVLFGYCAHCPRGRLMTHQKTPSLNQIHYCNSGSWLSIGKIKSHFVMRWWNDENIKGAVTTKEGRHARTGGRGEAKFSHVQRSPISKSNVIRGQNYALVSWSINVWTIKGQNNNLSCHAELQWAS